MALSKYKLGELISLSEEVNEDNCFSISDVRGISIKKEFIETKADMDGVSLRPYLLVKPGYFAYVTITSRNGDKISLAYNASKDTYIVSSSYVVFYVNKSKLLLPEYLYVFFNRQEFDRYSRFNSWGSAREAFSWEEMCDIDIELPPIEIQQKYVDIYQGMVNNQKAYERGLEDLKLVCDGYIEDLRRKTPSKAIGKYIVEQNIRNNNLEITNVQGVNSSSEFCATKASSEGLDFHNYKIVYEDFFAYNPSRINIGSIALQRKNVPPCIVSPMYIVFSIIDRNALLPEYLMLWFARKEFQRSTLFYATGSVRDTFDFSNMEEVKIPIPSIEIQKSIANIYKVYNTRKCINEQLKAQIKDICPILIKGSIDELK